MAHKLGINLQLVSHLSSIQTRRKVLPRFMRFVKRIDIQKGPREEEKKPKRQ